MAGSRPIHLARRGAYYLVRFRIPTALVPSLGIVEFRRSLNTVDRQIARQRCLQATQWFRTTIEALSNHPNPQRNDLEEAAISFFANMAEEIDQPRKFDRLHFDEEVNTNLELTRSRVHELDRQLISGDFDGRVHHRAREMAGSIDSDFTTMPLTERHFALKLSARAEREQLRFLEHQLTDPAKQYAAHDALFAIGRPTPSPSAPPTAGQGPTLATAINSTLTRIVARGLGKSQHDETARILRYLSERLGANRPLDSIQKVEVRTFRDDLVRLNAKFQGKATSFDQRLTNDPAEQLRSDTASRYWNYVASFFARAAAEGDIREDPTAGLKIDHKKNEPVQQPPPFTTEELQILLSTPLFVGHKSDKRLIEPGDKVRRLGHFWSALLFMYSGARASELAQLMPGDFVFEADIPHFKIRREDEDGNKTKSTKNDASVRDVPIAPILLDLGLREFVATRAKSNKRVLDEFNFGTGRSSDGLTKFWTRYLREVGLWKPRRSTHVWRHTLVTFMRANDVSDQDTAALIGHTPQTQTGSDGDTPLVKKAKTLNQLDYGFDVLLALGGQYDPTRHR